MMGDGMVDIPKPLLEIADAEDWTYDESLEEWTYEDCDEGELLQVMVGVVVVAHVEAEFGDLSIRTTTSSWEDVPKTIRAMRVAAKAYNDRWRQR